MMNIEVSKSRKLPFSTQKNVSREACQWLPSLHGINRAKSGGVLLWSAFLVCSLCFGYSGAMAQSLKHDLTEMRKFYDDIEDLHILMGVHVFESAETENSLYTLKVDIKKQGGSYRYHYGENQMLMNDKYLILVDGTAKEMICGKRKKNLGKEEHPFAFSLDSLLSFYGTPKYLGEDNRASRYRISQKVGPIHQLELWIDNRTNLLQRMDYWYREGAYVRIDFEIFNGSPTFKSDLFDEKHFIRNEGGTLTTAANYDGFHLVVNP